MHALANDRMRMLIQLAPLSCASSSVAPHTSHLTSAASLFQHNPPPCLSLSLSLNASSSSPRRPPSQYDINADGLIQEDFAGSDFGKEQAEDASPLSSESKAARRASLIANPEEVAKAVKEMKLRSSFGATATITYGPTELPSLPPKYFGTKAATRVLNTMGANWDPRQEVQQNVSTSSDFGGLVL